MAYGQIVDKHVETYVPSAGKMVMVVKVGNSEDRELIGQIGRIVEKNKKDETALVQMEHDLDFKVKLLKG